MAKGCGKSQFGYERELKDILMGNEKVLAKVTKTMDEYDKALYYKIQKSPFLVTRAGASLGVDLVAMRGDVSFPIEVKASKKDNFNFSSAKGRAMQQAVDYRDMCIKAKLVPVYAFRLKGVKGDSWRIFALGMDGVEGIMRLVYDKVPKPRVTPKGYLAMNWSDGMPLAKFIDYLCG